MSRELAHYSDVFMNVKQVSNYLNLNEKKIYEQQKKNNRNINKSAKDIYNKKNTSKLWNAFSFSHSRQRLSILLPSS